MQNFISGDNLVLNIKNFRNRLIFQKIEQFSLTTAFQILYACLGTFVYQCQFIKGHMNDMPNRPNLPTRTGGCSACGLCAAVCSAHAIEIRENEDGFLRPYVDSEHCRACHACERMCLKAADPAQESAPFSVRAYAAYTTDRERRLQASSGGVLSILAVQIVRKGGIVFGVSMKDRDHAEYISVERESDLPRLQGSKYLPADASVCYKEMAQVLRKGRSVLFVGLPCQVKAVRAKFGYRHENLLTADLACFGIPSKLAYNAWIRELETNAGKPVKHISFRDKTMGWKAYKMKVVYKDDSEEVIKNNPFHELFISGTCLNDACYACKKTATSHVSDLTVGDFWGGALTKEEQQLGVSCVVCHSRKGEDALTDMGELLHRSPISTDEAEHLNKGMRIGKRRMYKSRRKVLDALRRNSATSVKEQYVLPQGVPRYLLFTWAKRDIFLPNALSVFLYLLPQRAHKLLNLAAAFLKR